MYMYIIKFLSMYENDVFNLTFDYIFKLIIFINNSDKIWIKYYLFLVI